jgi:hypothetical protein
MDEDRQCVLLANGSVAFCYWRVPDHVPWRIACLDTGHFAELPDHLLRDIGIPRSKIAAAVRGQRSR